MIDFKNSLNEEQLDAVTAKDGPMLVLAAAGTGKTRTLVYRVAYLVSKGISPDRILLLTFTNRAAKEMLERARALVGADTGGMWAGTFHHMCNRILRRYAPKIDFHSDFAILDRDDSRTLMAGCIRDLGLKSKEFPKKEVLLSLAGAAANTEVSAEDLVKKRFADSVIDHAEILHAIAEYNRKKVQLGAMDFDDLLVNCLRLFKEHGEVLGRYQEQFMHVLVDEYQDTNTIQSQLVDCLAGRHRNVMVVGDDFQSIYSWRGANFMNIMSFPDRYKDSSLYKLETNYRSVPEVLGVANSCIAGNPEQFQKVIKATRECGNKPQVIKVRDGEAQARAVLQQVHLLRREGYNLSDIAVLYRAHFHAMELQIALTHERLSYVITSGVRFFEQAHIKDICCLMKIMENPADKIAFDRLLMLLPGVGSKTADRLWGKLGGRFDVRDESQRQHLLSIMPSGAVVQWEGINAIMGSYQMDNLSENVEEVMRRFFKVFYEQYVINSFDDHDRRLEDIREVMMFSAKYADIGQFINDIALLTNMDAEYEKGVDVDRDALNLSTIHQAKGLEWSAVIILWATEGMFPSARAMDESEGAEAEERRLFYVAVTRAKDELRIMVPELRRMRDGGVYYCEASRFVSEIPTDLVQEIRGSYL